MAWDSSATTTSGQNDEPRACIGLRWLEVMHGNERGARQVLDRDPISIGRAGFVEGTLALTDTGVSKSHAEVRPDPVSGRWEVNDLGSRNGTFVNGVRQERAHLTRGSIVRIGAALLLYDEAELFDDEGLEPANGILEGSSISMQRVRAEIRRFAPHPLPALVLGESGVGKELAAVEIHRQSRRRGPLVSVNCAAISPQLAESEIFGHVAGAFTGAIRKQEGLFAAAANGTLLLDEIGEMALDLQAKLLRAIAVGEVRPVGSAQPERIDVRVVAATNRDLDKAVEEGKFRGDLLARLRGWTLKIPPLRERRDDVLGLARKFLKKNRSGTLTADAAEALLLYAWPYNVRELEQVIATAAVRSDGGPITAAHLPDSIAEPVRARAKLAGRDVSPVKPPTPLALLVPSDRPPTRDELERVLDRLEGNMAEAAAFFGKDRRQVYRWAERLGIDPERFRKS